MKTLTLGTIKKVKCLKAIPDAFWRKTGKITDIRKYEAGKTENWMLVSGPRGTEYFLEFFTRSKKFWWISGLWLTEEEMKEVA